MPRLHDWVSQKKPLPAEAVEEVATLLAAMDGMSARLVLRLGQSHPVTVKFIVYVMACNDVRRSILTKAFQPTDEERPSMSRHLERLRRDFLVACQRVVGSKVSGSGEEVTSGVRQAAEE